MKMTSGEKKIWAAVFANAYMAKVRLAKAATAANRGPIDRRECAYWAVLEAREALHTLRGLGSNPINGNGVIEANHVYEATRGMIDE